MEIIKDKNNDIKVIWFDEQINNEENKDYFKQLKSKFNKSERYELLDEGFNNLYKNNNDNDFKIIFVIVSGRLFGKYIKKIKDNINKIINIPYTFIFTSSNYKKLLLKLIPDRDHILSYDTMMTLNNGFYNPGGIYDDFDKLFNEIKIINEKILSNINIKQRIKDKINYEGILTFEYLESEEDLLAPALYKDIITNEKITKEDCKNFHKFILSYNEDDLNTLTKNLELFTYIPFEILSKYWVRFYTIESDFYKVLNNHLMKSKLSFNYKTFIKMLYRGIEINSLKSYPGKYLYRGSAINKKEIEKIKKYKNIGKLSNVVVFSKAFLSFSEDRDKAKSFCGKSDDTKIGCLYILENNNINLHESNADIQNFSVFPEEKEILFLPGSSFIIKNINEIKDNKIEIKLNYNGKFKEKYSLIYEDKEKINNLIFKNQLTKNISGKELIFLKNGKYLIEEILGSGTFGQIFKGKDLETDEIISIKQILKNSEDFDYAINEAYFYKNMSEKIKYSCKFKDFFETENYFYIILAYYDDDLYNFFNKRKNEKKNFPPNLIKKVFKQLNEAFKELLNHHIVHKDIKPENILIKFNNEDETNFDSALSDYGVSEEYDDENQMETMVGSIYYMAPEIMKGEKYNNKCDLYSIGITIYYLYFGEFPFKKGANIFDIMNKKQSNIKVKIEEDRELEDLITKLLKENPNERISWEEYFDHSFFKQYEY